MSVRDSAVSVVRHVLRRFDARVVRDRPMRDPVRLLLLKAQELGVRTILDVGANAGQFASETFEAGWHGEIVSFEPIAVNHQRLVAAAQSNARWIVAPAVALGSQAGTSEINVSENLVSSSLLPIETTTTSVVRETRYVRTETIEVRRLDDVLDPAWPGPFAIKTDTQGFDLEVLKGAPETLKQARVLMIEMSMAPLYEGGARFCDLCTFIEDAGFRCIALTEGFADYARNEVLQVDGVFVRDK